jgi:hypothetical protein
VSSLLSNYPKGAVTAGIEIDVLGVEFTDR